MLTPVEINRIINGIADYTKEALEYSVAFLRRIDYRSDPRKWKLLPKPTKESGSVILDLPIWGERVGDITYIYGDTGYFYTRSLAGSVANVLQVSGSHGNGMKYFGEDDFLYLTTDSVIARYGRISGTPSFVADFLGSEGGIPLNTSSMDFESTSSMSADAADSASLSITGDISLEAWVKFESLPTAGNEMVIMSKWNGNSDERSYKMAVVAVSGLFGDGSDGALTIASNTTEAPIDSACTGTSGEYSLTATNVSFAVGQRVLIHQTKGTGAGSWQINTISGYTAGTITLQDALNTNYSTGAQVRVLKQYTNVTINSGITYTAKAWDGTVGGILAFLANGTTTVTGTITAAGKGFAGGTGNQSGVPGEQGDSPSGAGTTSTAANGSGGGGGEDGDGAAAGGGAGGGHGATGTNGQAGARGGGTGGSTDGNAQLTDLVFGGGGGAGGRRSGGVGGGNGGNGGGIVAVISTTLTVSGAVLATGSVGSAYGGGSDSSGGGGGGAGGAILLKSQTATLGTTLITSSGGAGGAGKVGSVNDGGAGAVGRIHLDYITSYTGTTSPSLDATQDANLGGNTVYHLRFYVSATDGTSGNSEYYTKEITGLSVDIWNHFAIAWDASASTVYLYVNGIQIGTAVGAKTDIYNGTALFAIAADYSDAGATRSFLDGKVDDVRVWDDIRSASEIEGNKENELAGTEANLKAYYQLDSSASDSTSNANNLTLRNTPTYDTTDVPFSMPTTRRDIDQEDTSTGQTYATPAAIDETATHRQSFVPAKDPQKSLMVHIDTIGTNCSWTLTIHDALNRTVASKTVANADLNTGHFEFIYATPWTPVIGATYHFHVTTSNTTGAPKLVSGGANDLETGQFTSYYQFLVTDTKFHPIDDMLNFLSIGNGRYVATWDGGTYNPHRLTFPSTYKVRCVAKWREYQAFGLWRGDNIEDYDKGIIIFWDGISDTYNFYIEVPEGGINAMIGKQGTLYIYAGYKGDLLEYTGGDRAKKIKRIPNLEIDKQIEILPGAITIWQTMLRIGAGVTDSESVEQGVYSWGALNESYPDSLSYDYFISTETNKSTGVKVGMLLPVAKKLLVGWKDGTAYGLDSIDMSGDCVTEGSIEFIIRDSGQVSKEKMLQIVRADFEPLVSGQSVGLQYKLDRVSSWSAEETEDTADKTFLRSQLGGSATRAGRHKEYQLRVNLHSTTGDSPSVLDVVAGEDTITGEEYL